MFSFTPLGLVLLACGISYMAFFGHRLLPERKSGTLTEAYQVKEYITEVEILEAQAAANRVALNCSTSARRSSIETAARARRRRGSSSGPRRSSTPCQA